MSRKKSIALLIDKIDNSFYDSMVKGAKMAAQELGINLMVVSHGHVHSGENTNSVRYQDFSKVDYQKNTLMSVCMTDSVDLIILDPDSLCENGNDSSKLMSMLSKKKKLIIGDNIPGYACIQYDNKKGVREALEYLIKEKECTKIAMLAGPKDSKDANERLDAYKEVMEENGLPILPGMIVHFDVSRTRSIKAIEAAMLSDQILALFLRDELGRRNSVNQYFQLCKVENLSIVIIQVLTVMDYLNPQSRLIQHVQIVCHCVAVDNDPVKLFEVFH